MVLLLRFEIHHSTFCGLLCSDFLMFRSQKLINSHTLFNPAPPEAMLTCDSCTNGNAKTVFIGVGIGIAIGVELLKTDPDSDTDPDPECLSRRISNFEVLVCAVLLLRFEIHHSTFCGSLFAPASHWQSHVIQSGSAGGDARLRKSDFSKTTPHMPRP